MNSEQGPASSPCISKCTLNNEKICTGCFRSLNEISLWSQVDNNMRHQFLSNIKNRKNFYKVTE
ncbi:MAG: hypothetical protein RIT35_357 [Pseudomonadota bacterium]|jgi:predicted Fe-S protein YdhL (DUF1289 family)